ncbi:MAG: hypothetical protein IPM25_00610 [Chloracidobacterium sp.]|nr:hypothetical protein [Chloracidobacterium sp.]
MPAGPVTEMVAHSHGRVQFGHSTTRTVWVWVWPQRPHPSSTPAVIVYEPG